MKTLMRNFGIYFTLTLMIVLFGSNITLANSGKNHKISETQVTALKSIKKMNKKSIKENKTKKAPNWKKWKKSTDQKYFH